MQHNYNNLNNILATNIIQVLSKLNIDTEQIIDYGNRLTGPAPCHGGDNKTGWTLFFDSNKWKCWTHSCEKKYGNDCISLLSCILDYEREDVTKLVDDFIKSNNINVQNVRIAKPKKKENYWQDHQTYYTGNYIPPIKSGHKFAIERKLYPQLFNKYKIGVYNGKGNYLKDRLLIPIYNAFGKLVGYTCRLVTWNKQIKKPKWIHYPSFGDYKIKTKVHLFNVNNAITYNIENKLNDYILVEGPFDVLKLEMCGIHNSICTFGAHVSEGQIEILKQIGATNIYLAYDGDNAGKSANNKFFKRLRHTLFNTTLIDLKSHFPDWNQEKLGTLDWANGNISIEKINDIMKSYI